MYNKSVGTLAVLSFLLVPFLPLMKEGTGAKGGGSLNSLFSLGQKKNATDVAEFVTLGFFNNSKKNILHISIIKILACVQLKLQEASDSMVGALDSTPSGPYSCPNLV